MTAKRHLAACVKPNIADFVLVHEVVAWCHVAEVAKDAYAHQDFGDQDSLWFELALADCQDCLKAREKTLKEAGRA